jgi:putative ATPase
VATAAAQAVQQVGLPEAQLNLAQAVVHLATAPKSNSVTTALGAAMADVRAGRGGAVPAHLRDSHYPGSRGLGHGKGYRYPHDDHRGVVTQQYAPDDLTGADYYRPTEHGAERAVAERLPRLRRIVRGTPAPASRPPAPSASPSAPLKASSGAAEGDPAGSVGPSADGEDARSTVGSLPGAVARPAGAEPDAAAQTPDEAGQDDGGEIAGKEQP